MWIIKKRSELLRFGLFLLIVSGMAFFIASNVGVWLKSSPDPTAGEERPVTTGVELPPEAAEAPEQDFFAVYRFDRDRARSELKETLREVMVSPSADETTRQEANRRYLSLGRAAEVERRAESLLRAKGFADAIVELSDGTVQVIIRAPGLDEAKAAQVIDIVARLSGVRPQQINIMTRGS